MVPDDDADDEEDCDKRPPCEQPPHNGLGTMAGLTIVFVQEHKSPIGFNTSTIGLISLQTTFGLLLMIDGKIFDKGCGLMTNGCTFAAVHTSLPLPRPQLQLNCA